MGIVTLISEIFRLAETARGFVSAQPSEWSNFAEVAERYIFRHPIIETCTGGKQSGAIEKEFALCGLLSVALAPVPSTFVETYRRRRLVVVDTGLVSALAE